MKAVFFDVDFTLIYPGPTFQGSGYQEFCRRYGIDVDPDRFEAAVANASPLLEADASMAYDAEIFVRYTRHIIERMGGCGERLDECAREIYAEWAACQHFELYEEVPAVLKALAASGIRLGLISNSHRCLASFQSHFELEGVIAGAVSSSEHGLMKPHPSIFRAALDLFGIAASDALMVGDSVGQDVRGALAVGMRAALVHRGDQPHPEQAHLSATGVPILRSLRDVARVL
jgi:putative hydrolase of the HAD superfamily